MASFDVVEELKKREYFFETAFSLSGELLEKDKDGYFLQDAMSEEIKRYLPKEEYIVLTLNELVLERMDKNMRGIFALRGIKSEEEVNENDIEVKLLAKNWQKRNKHKGIYSTIPKNILSTFIQQVKRKHRPNQLLVMFQVVLFSIMADDVFVVNKHNNSFTSKIDVKEETLEKYWDGQVEEIGGNGLDDFIENSMKNFKTEPIFIDRTNTLEIMLAVCSCIAEDYEKFSEVAQNKISEATKAYYAWSNRNNEFFRQNDLDELLSEEVESQYADS
jgi:hypothetical protein